ncbi:MAG: hypothetical protein HXY20_02665 [Acidobacteria bacterium]|nr:hypothetical protein [Acidobacteriota bacterium]
MGSSDSNRVALFERIVRRLNLRFPFLFGIFAILTVIDLAVPDFLPFVDELGLAFLTLLLGLWNTRRTRQNSGS